MRETIALHREQVRAAIARRLAWQAAAACGLVVWLWITLDRLFEPSAGVRSTFGWLLVAGAVAWLLLVVGPRLLKKISDRQVLTLLHRPHPQEAALMATALDLLQRPAAQANPLAEESIAAADRAAQSLAGVRLDRPLMTMGAVWFASVALSGLMVLGIARPDLARALASRLALSERPWPRRIELAPEGFRFDEGSGEWRLVAARGEPMEFSVVAEAAADGRLPRTVWARGGPRNRLTTLTRVGQPVVEETQRQRFRRRVERLEDDLAMTIRGGDASLRLRIVAGERPRVVETRILCEPPAYLQRPTIEASPTTLTPLPEGGTIVIRAGSTKPLQRVEASVLTGQEIRAAPAALSEDGCGVVIEAPTLEESSLVTVTVTDQDGLTSAPVEVPLEITPDTPPTARLALDGTGRAITRDALVRVVATVDDDHGVASVAMRAGSSAGRSVTLPMAPPIALPGEVEGEADLLTLRSAGAAEKLAVEEGDRLTLVAVAEDRYDLSEREPTESQPIVLEVVSPAELLARIGDAQRELRRGVDSLLADAERLEYEIDLGRRRFAEAEALAQGDVDRWASERLLDARKAAQGVGEAADRAEGLRRQIVNNRLDQPALVDRLATAVVGPLKRVVKRDLSGVRQRLESLAPDSYESALSDAGASAHRAAESLRRVAASLDSQQTYNEVVSLLRGLIREQRAVNEQTAREEADNARSLLLD